jgi:hypothetical protein
LPPFILHSFLLSFLPSFLPSTDELHHHSRAQSKTTDELHQTNCTIHRPHQTNCTSIAGHSTIRTAPALHQHSRPHQTNCTSTAPSTSTPDELHQHSRPHQTNCTSTAPSTDPTLWMQEEGPMPITLWMQEDGQYQWTMERCCAAAASCHSTTRSCGCRRPHHPLDAGGWAITMDDGTMLRCCSQLPQHDSTLWMQEEGPMPITLWMQETLIVTPV